ncbi:hypothetical protein [Actinoallomurus iriomotensis]|uniref:Lipoprotein n=1 Tax=Actinoallomurus iriomotensis TaxID=478107 RepID=A0A9W6VWQ7_9ACTN|nr:hypothetical protein [Actinoallomurus iriomotensis]GLY83075.1 hypothetical protein Airi02_010050 [Actinoallomurus iriomotensis]
MRRGLPAVLTLVFVLAGCRLTGGADEAGPPAGGWPQPAGNRVTTQMCGLLTKADYSKLGHVLRPSMSSTVNDGTNTLDCSYQSVDAMSLTLRPTAEAARSYFAADLADHKQQLASGHRASVLAKDVVALADDSWFDNWTAGTAEQGAHEIRVRRGALVLSITLNGKRGKKEGDPRSVLTNLADLVLRRLPHAGTKDTGTNHKVQYEVIGLGRATSIWWQDFTGVQSAGSVENTRMPWIRTVSMATSPGTTPDEAVVHVQTTSTTTKIGCLILVDGEPVAAERPQTGGDVECRGQIPEDDSGSGAQPAAYRPVA